MVVGPGPRDQGTKHFIQHTYTKFRSPSEIPCCKIHAYFIRKPGWGQGRHFMLLVKVDLARRITGYLRRRTALSGSPCRPSPAMVFLSLIYTCTRP